MKGSSTPEPNEQTATGKCGGGRHFGTPQQFQQVLKTTERVVDEAPGQYWERPDVRHRAAALASRLYSCLTQASEDDDLAYRDEGWPTDDEVAGVLHAVRRLVIQAPPGTWNGKARLEGRGLAEVLANRLRESEGE